MVSLKVSRAKLNKSNPPFGAIQGPRSFLPELTKLLGFQYMGHSYHCWDHDPGMLKYLDCTPSGLHTAFDSNVIYQIEIMEYVGTSELFTSATNFFLCKLFSFFFAFIRLGNSSFGGTSPSSSIRRVHNRALQNHIHKPTERGLKKYIFMGDQHKHGSTLHEPSQILHMGKEPAEESKKSKN
ncbi:hypothetical protein YC2023_082178 [Brassica napus]